MEGLIDSALGTMVAADFFTAGVWARRGLQRFLLLFFIGLSNPTGKDRRSRGASQRAKDEPDSPKYQ
jgi:hypothetical protein